MTDHAERLNKLLHFLSSDPGNPELLCDCIETAFAAGNADVVRDLLQRSSELPPLIRARIGMAAMQARDFAIARDVLTPLHACTPDDPNIRFNLAWSLAMEQDKAASQKLLDASTVAALPQAAMLKVQLTHEEGRFEEAAELAAALLQTHPSHPGLLAAASVLAVDNEDLALAAHYAERAGDHPEALTTLGVVALSQDRGLEAAGHFARALALNAHAPRAWIGAGLTKMLSGEHAAAAVEITRGAEIFGSHIGSWIGAGWASLLAHDRAAARAAFDRAMALDHSFSESHGSIAVLDILEGHTGEARRGAETALRLDAKSFSGALARALLASSDNRPELANAIINRALNTPIDQTGRTIAQSLARLGLGT